MTTRYFSSALQDLGDVEPFGSGDAPFASCFLAIDGSVRARRSHIDKVGCGTPTSRESIVALGALGPLSRSIIRSLNFSE
jgi:hypothetical protein